MREGDGRVQVNLFETLDASLRAVDADAFTVLLSARPGEAWDATVVVRDDAFAEMGRDVVAQDRDISAVAPSGARFVLRYMDDAIADLGAALEAGEPAGMDAGDLLDGAPCIVDFCDPAAGKALHLGHLRNIAHGHALAAALQAGGAHVERWSQIADAGQDATLARLGVRFDRPIYDSERVPEIPALVEAALAAGVFRRKGCGTIVFDTGEESCPELPLTRPDGFPTQNLRVVATWLALMRELPDHRLIHFSGDEWRAHRTHVDQLLRALCPGATPFPMDCLLHGMVVTEDGVMSSSRGEPLLIDAVFEQLLEAPAMREIAPEERAGATAEDLVAMTLLGVCLDRPTAKRLVVAPQRLLDERANGGWRLARAWARAWSSDADGAADPAPRDPAYRYLVMQSQLHRAQVRAVAEKLDTYMLVRYLTTLAEWYLGTPPSPRVDRLMRQILGRGLSALGLLRDAPMRQPVVE